MDQEVNQGCDVDALPLKTVSFKNVKASLGLWYVQKQAVLPHELQFADPCIKVFNVFLLGNVSSLKRKKQKEQESH